MNKDEFKGKLEHQALELIDSVTRLIHACGGLVRAKESAQNDENAYKKNGGVQWGRAAYNPHAGWSSGRSMGSLPI